MVPQLNDGAWTADDNIIDRGTKCSCLASDNIEFEPF